MINNSKQLLFSLFLFVFILKLLEALTLFSNGDALFYHLPLADLWQQIGLFETYKNLCNGLISGYFDHLYYLTVNPFDEAWKGQVASQVLHFLFSLGGGALFFLLYFRKNFFIAVMGAISILTISESSDVFLYAKNDGALAIVSLLSAVYTFDPRSKKNPYIVGILLGLMPAIKMNGIFMTIPISLIYTFQNRKNLTCVFKAGVMAIICWAPILIRNAYFIGNPIFPGLVEFFPGKATPDMIDDYSGAMSRPLTFDNFFKHLGTFFTAKIVILLGFLGFWFRDKTKEILPYVLSSICFFFLYISVNGGIHYPRHFFPVIFINIFVTFKILDLIKIDKKWAFFIFAVVFVDSKVDKTISRLVKLPSQFQKISEGNLYDVEMFSTKAQIWEKLQHEKDIKVIAHKFNQIYYAPPGTILHNVSCNLQAGILRECSETDFEKLKQYDYAILGKSRDNKCYRFIKDQPLVDQVLKYKLYKID